MQGFVATKSNVSKACILAVRAVVKVYPFDEGLRHFGGAELLEEVRAALPAGRTITAEEAFSTVQINTVVTPALISDIATYRAGDQGGTLASPRTYDEKVGWAMDWLRSFGDAGVDVYTFQPMIDGTGVYYGSATGSVVHTPNKASMPELTDWQVTLSIANPDQEILNLDGNEQFWDGSDETTQGIQNNRQTTGVIGDRTDG